MIEIKDLCVVYPDGTEALRNLSFTVESDRKVAILGGNGAGKTTLFYAMMGLVPITNGAIYVDQLPVEKKTFREIRKMIGLVFQHPDDQLFSLTIFDDVAFGLRNQKLPETEIQERTHSTLTQLGIVPIRDKNPVFLSGGEKRLAALASVLAMDPGTILLDEPGAFLDPRSRKRLITILRSLDKTCLIATHDLDLAWDLCDEVIVLDRGNLAYQGAANPLFSDERKLLLYGLELPLSCRRKNS